MEKPDLAQGLSAYLHARGKELPPALTQELSAYLWERQGTCQDLLFGTDFAFLPFLYLMWERDFYKEKLLGGRNGEP